MFVSPEGAARHCVYSKEYRGALHAAWQAVLTSGAVDDRESCRGVAAQCNPSEGGQLRTQTLTAVDY